MWIQHDSFMETVANCWRNTLAVGCPMYVTISKLKGLKSCLRTWNHAVFGNIHSNVEQVRKALESIQQEISSHGISSTRFYEEVTAKQTLMQALHRQHIFWKERARISWLKDGDRCTKFFHTYARIKAAKSRICSMNINDQVVVDENVISDHIVDYYRSLYSSSSADHPFEDLSSIIPSLFTEV